MDFGLKFPSELGAQVLLYLHNAHTHTRTHGHTHLFPPVCDHNSYLPDASLIN